MLDALKDDEAMQLRNEARTQSSIDLISNLPLTLDNLIKEEEDRREKLRATKVREDVTERQTKVSEAASKRAERESIESRIKDAMENVVPGTAAYEGGPTADTSVPMPSKGGPDTAVPMPSKGGPDTAVPMPSKGGPDTAVPMPQPNLGSAQVPQQPILGGQEPALSPSIPISATEAKKEYALNPVIQARFEKAKAVFQSDPRFASSFKDEELLGLIVLDERKRQAAQEAAQYKQDSLGLREKDIDSKIKERDARIKKLSRPVTVKTKEDQRGLTNKDRDFMRERELQIHNLNRIAAALADGTYNPGLINGYGNKIRNILKMRNPEDASSIAMVQTMLNQVIKEISGATVTDSELTRVATSMPSTFDDRETLETFIEWIREDAAMGYNITLDLAERGRRSAIPLPDRIARKDTKTGKDIAPEPKKDEPKKSIDQRIDEKFSKIFGE